jgi:hypothetical protein
VRVFSFPLFSRAVLLGGAAMRVVLFCCACTHSVGTTHCHPLPVVRLLTCALTCTHAACRSVPHTF